MFMAALKKRALSLKSARHNRARRGATAVEMALIAPVFFTMFIGITEMSLVMLTQHLIENATYNATRLAKTGYTATDKTQEQTVRDLLTQQLSSLSPLICAGDITMTHTAYANLSNVGQPDQAIDSLGTAQQIVVYTVSYPWKVFTPMMGALIGGGDGQINLTSRIVVRNEPYS